MRKKALLIGNSNYQYPGIEPLTAPKEDILKLRDVLLDPAMGGFDTVTSKFDLDTQSAKREISRLFQGAGRDDLIVFYYAGHGIRDVQGDLFLATHDTDKSLIDASALEASYLLGKLARCASQKKVVILDCCHAGAVIDSGSLFLARDIVDDALIKDNFMPQGEGTYVLAACKAGESAFESKEGKYSIYTRTLIEAITTGNAAPEKDVLTINDIHEYIRDERLYNRDTDTANPHTEPLMIAAQADSLEISLNPNVRRPLNTSLMEALSDENYLTRIGAVSALQEIIDGTDSYQTESAIKTLEERLLHEFDRRVEKKIKAVLSVSKKSEPVQPPSPPIVSEAEEQEESIEKLLLRFLKNWPTWGFTLRRIKKWGGKQDGFEGLKWISSADLLKSLESLLVDKKIKELTSSKGNRLFQYASTSDGVAVIIIEDETGFEKIQNFLRRYKSPLMAIAVSLALSLAVFAYKTFEPTNEPNGPTKPSLSLDADKLLREASALANANRHDDALIKLDQALSVSSLNAEQSSIIYQMQGKSFYALKKYDQAINAYKNAIEEGGLLPAEQTKLRENIAALQDRLKNATPDSALTPYYCDVIVTTAPVTKTFTKSVLVKEAEPYYKLTPATFQSIEKTIIVQEAGPEGSSYRTETETFVVQQAYKDYIAVPAKFGSSMKSVSFGDYKGKSLKAEYLFQGVVEDPKIEGRTIPAVTKSVQKKVLTGDVKQTGRMLPAVTRTFNFRIVKTPPGFQKLSRAGETKTLTETFELEAGRREKQIGVCDVKASPALVKDIQSKLSMSPDGVWGAGTQNALIAYQKKNELSSGALTLQTLKSLGLDPKKHKISDAKP